MAKTRDKGSLHLEETTGEEVQEASKDIKILLSQYFDQFRPEVHKYTRAYVSANFHGMLKTRDEWYETLKEHIGG